MTEPLEKINEPSDSSKKGVLELKKELNDVYLKKEEWFKKKEDFKKELHELIVRAQSLQAHLDARNSEIAKLKNERDVYNKKVQGLVVKIKKEGKQTPRKGNLAIIKKEIEGLEKKIEFQAIDFSTEKKMMKKLKELQKRYFDLLKGEKEFKESQALSTEIDAAKKTSNELHKKILGFTQGSDEYKEHITVSRKINAVKKDEEKAFSEFVKYKNSYVEINNFLKKKLVVEQQKFAKKSEPSKKKEGARMKLEEKRRLIEEKMRRGEKLTTDDLIVFQDV